MLNITYWNFVNRDTNTGIGPENTFELYHDLCTVVQLLVVNVTPK